MKEQIKRIITLYDAAKLYYPDEDVDGLRDMLADAICYTIVSSGEAPIGDYFILHQKDVKRKLENHGEFLCNVMYNMARNPFVTPDEVAQIRKQAYEELERMEKDDTDV